MDWRGLNCNKQCTSGWFHSWVPYEVWLQCVLCSLPNTLSKKSLEQSQLVPEFHTKNWEHLKLIQVWNSECSIG